MLFVLPDESFLPVTPTSFHRVCLNRLRRSWLSRKVDKCRLASELWNASIANDGTGDEVVFSGTSAG